MFPNTFTNSMLTSHQHIQSQFLLPPTNTATLNTFTDRVDSIVARDFPRAITEQSLNGYCNVLNSLSKKADENSGICRFFKMCMASYLLKGLETKYNPNPQNVLPPPHLRVPQGYNIKRRHHGLYRVIPYKALDLENQIVWRAGKTLFFWG